jgi:hypothetical protein
MVEHWPSLQLLIPRSLNRNKIIYLLSSLSFLYASNLQATDFWTVVRTGCAAESGLIVGVDDSNINMLTIDGRLSVVQKAEIESMNRYRSVSMPLARFSPPGSAKNLLSVEMESGEAFAGYAYEFSDESVLFLDSKARTRVVDMRNIRAIRMATAVTDNPGKTNLDNKLMIPSENKCPLKFIGDAALPVLAPVQTYDSPFKITRHLEEMETGYRALEGLRERIDFYPKPTMFDKRTRIGFFSDMGDEVKYPLKIVENLVYLETGNGDSYKFQSHIIFGSNRFKNLPTSDIVFGIESQFKSHLIHGSLTGNLAALRAGDHVDAQNFKDSGFPTPWLKQSFNHETLLGVDYKGWFLDTGYYFPVFIYGIDKEFREMTAVKPSQIVALGWQNAKFRAQVLIYSTTSVSKSDPYEGSYLRPNNTESSDSINYNAVDEVPNSIHANAKHFRLNLVYTFDEALDVGGSLITGNLKLKENGNSFNGETFPPTLGAEYLNEWTYQQSEVTAFLRYDVGQYIGLRAECLMQKNKLEFKTASESLHNNQNVNKYSVGLEFIL